MSSNLDDHSGFTVTVTLPESPSPIGPYWWHQHGLKMEITESTPFKLVIASRAASLTITAIEASQDGQDRWNVQWQIIHTQMERVQGNCIFYRHQLTQALGAQPPRGVTPFSPGYFDHVLYEQGQYVRDGKYLNIPCRGTGHDGDPNISIMIEDDIEQAVALLLQKRPNDLIL